MMKNINHQKDLRLRTTKFGEYIIDFCKKIPVNEITRPIIGQLISAGTSVGANYREADNCSSKRDFRNKIIICKKEACESNFWLQMTARACPFLADEARILWKESHELTLIFGSISRSK